MCRRPSDKGGGGGLEIRENDLNEEALFCVMGGHMFMSGWCYDVHSLLFNAL